MIHLAVGLDIDGVMLCKNGTHPEARGSRHLFQDLDQGVSGLYRRIVFIDVGKLTGHDMQTFVRGIALCNCEDDFDHLIDSCVNPPHDIGIFLFFHWEIFYWPFLRLVSLERTFELCISITGDSQSA